MPYANPVLRNLSAKRRREVLGRAAPPEGFDPVKVTTDSEGEVVTVQSRRSQGEHYQTVPEGHAIKGVSTFLDSAGEITAQWVKTDRLAQERWQVFCASLDKKMAQYADPKYALPYIKRQGVWSLDELHTVYPIGDPHIGMLAWHQETDESFDLKIAEAHLMKAMDLLVDKAPASSTATIANMGDFFHSQTNTNLTPTGGNKLDVDSRVGKVFDLGFDMLERIVLRALERHESVEVINLPGNHDPDAGRMVAKYLRAVFRHNPRVTIANADNPYVFRRFGDVLLGYHHGDGAKPDQLPGIMAEYDGGRPWGTTEYRQWWTGHVHHQNRKEYPGVVWESVRTLAPRDYWHHHKGYRSGRSLACVTYHKHLGEDVRRSVSIKEVQWALAAERP